MHALFCTYVYVFSTRYFRGDGRSPTLTTSRTSVYFTDTGIGQNTLKSKLETNLPMQNVGMSKHTSEVEDAADIDHK